MVSLFETYIFKLYNMLSILLTTLDPLQTTQTGSRGEVQLLLQAAPPTEQVLVSRTTSHSKCSSKLSVVSSIYRLSSSPWTQREQSLEGYVHQSTDRWSQSNLHHRSTEQGSGSRVGAGSRRGGVRGYSSHSACSTLQEK